MRREPHTSCASTVSASSPALRRGYAVIARVWTPGDTVTLVLPMPVRRVVADARVADTRGKVALERGPLVYAAEWSRQRRLRCSILSCPTVPPSTRSTDPTCSAASRWCAQRRPTRRAAAAAHGDPVYAWSHRGPGEMAVWLPRAAQQTR